MTAGPELWLATTSQYGDQTTALGRVLHSSATEVLAHHRFDCGGPSPHESFVTRNPTLVSRHGFWRCAQHPSRRHDDGRFVAVSLKPRTGGY